MPLPNRISPFGEFLAVPARGLLMGNRGGRLHDPATRTLGPRRWASRRWICCRLRFKGRRRAVWASGYTELFFCDEVTALAAGHRPCMECRRADALAFREALVRGLGLGERPSFEAIDRRLHAERLDGRRLRLHRREARDLPDGAVIAGADWTARAVRGGATLLWTPDGYGARQPLAPGPVDVLTPPTTLAALTAGYRPLWHPGAAA